jgi:hypothetical protein
VLQPAKLKRDFLFEDPTLGAQENYPHRWISGPNAGDGSRQGFRFHDHTAAAPKWSIIRGTMWTAGVIADVGDLDLNEFSGYGLANYAFVERPCHHTGEYGQNVNDH